MLGSTSGPYSFPLIYLFYYQCYSALILVTFIVSSDVCWMKYLPVILKQNDKVHHILFFSRYVIILQQIMMLPSHKVVFSWMKRSNFFKQMKLFMLENLCDLTSLIICQILSMSWPWISIRFSIFLTLRQWLKSSQRKINQKTSKFMTGKDCYL